MRTIHRYVRALAVAALLVSPSLPALAQSLGVYASFQQTGQTSIDASTVSANKQLGSIAPTAWVCNVGDNVGYVALGTLNVGVTVASGFRIPPAFCASLNSLGTTYIAAITPSGTTTFQVSTGTGWPAGSQFGTQSISVTTAPATGAVVTTPVTAGTSSALALAGATRVYLKICNESASKFIAYKFGAAAVLNAAGSMTLLPFGCDTYESSYVPSDAVNAIASAAATPITILSK